MAELAKAKLKLGNLKSPEPIEPRDFSNISKSTRRVPASKIQKSKIIENVLDETITGLDKPFEPSKPSKPSDQSKLSSPGAGERFAILVMEDEIKNMYDNVEYLNNKLKDNSLTLAEYKKISDDIDKIKKSILTKEQKLYESKRDLEKRTRTRTDQARSFKDQNK